MGSGDWTQTVSLGSKHPYPLSHVVGPVLVTFFIPGTKTWQKPRSWERICSWLWFRRASPHSKAEPGNQAAKLMVVISRKHSLNVMPQRLTSAARPTFSPVVWLLWIHQAELWRWLILETPSQTSTWQWPSQVNKATHNEIFTFWPVLLHPSQIRTLSPTVGFVSFCRTSHYSPSRIFRAFICRFSVPILNNRILIR